MASLVIYLSTATLASPGAYFLKISNKICLRNLSRLNGRTSKLNYFYFMIAVTANRTSSEPSPSIPCPLTWSTGCDLLPIARIILFGLDSADGNLSKPSL